MEQYLVHHGIKGQKWGVRRYQAKDGSLTSLGRQQLKADYKLARKESKETRKSLLKERSQYVNIFGGAKSPESAKKAKVINNKLMNNELKRVQTKAEYNKIKGGEKKEFNTYAREMRKSGQPGSYADIIENSGRSTKMYNDLSKRKGKAYAEKITKHNNKVLVGEIIGASALAIGSEIAYWQLNK